VRWRSGPAGDLAEGRHAAYPGIEHRRTVIFDRHHFAIQDDLEGRGEHWVDVRYCLAPGARVERDGPWARVRGAGGAGVDLGVLSATPFELRIDDGWVATDYGQRARAKVVIFSARARLPLRVVTHLVPRTRTCAASPAS
jgi:heparinase II/III-like protein